MASDRKRVRGTILYEDPRTGSFFRKLLRHLGFEPRNFMFRPAPSGKRDAGAWVQTQYHLEVRPLRRKRHQRSLCLIAVRDGDNVGTARRKTDLDASLITAGLQGRQQNELIATPIPTWNIETWLLALLGIAGVDENASRKLDFESRYSGTAERQALADAADAWSSRAEQIASVPSLADGKVEFSRIDPP